MIKRDYNYLNMVKRTTELLYENTDHWNNNNALETTLNTIETLNTKIENYFYVQQTSSKGYTEEKRKLRKIVIQYTDIITSAIYAYASSTGDDVLKNKVKYSRWAIGRLRDIKLSIITNTFIEIATFHIEALQNYNITQEFLDKYITEVNKFNDISSMPLETIKIIKSATITIKVTMRELRTVISEHLDSIMKIYEITAPEFYIEYTKQREIIDTPTHKLSLKGTVTDSETNEPIQQAIITIPELDQEKETTEKGNYQFKRIKRGTYNLLFQRIGYKSKTITIIIEESRTTTLDITLERLLI